MKKFMKRAARAARVNRPTYVADGARYCAPYSLWWHSGFPSAAKAFADGPLPLVEALENYCKVNNGNGNAALQTGSWTAACGHGHVQLKRQREDRAFWTADESTLARNGDEYKILLCVHEPPITAERPSVLHESDAFVVVDKPAGLPTTGVCSGASLCVEGVLAEDEAPLYPGHRLDQPVSGVLILCRSPKNQKRVVQAAGSGAARKRYVARVRPVTMPLSDAAVCDAPLGLMHGRAVPCAEPHGRPASTYVIPLTSQLTDGTQLVECTPLQGRKHQIRAHLALLGLPIANDPLYGGVGGDAYGACSTAAAPALARALAESCMQFQHCPRCSQMEEEARATGSVKLPRVMGGIWLHARHYQIASLEIDVEAPLPAWAIT